MLTALAILCQAGSAPGFAQGTAPSFAQRNERSPAALVRRGNEHVAAGAIPEALGEYAEAEKLLPGSPVIAYNRGVAQYRAGDYSKAAESFTSALVTRDPGLEARARFNLGNTAYATALQQHQDPKAAVEMLKEAIGHYRSVLDIASDDRDARANIERAQTLIRQILEQPPQQQQQQPSDPNQSPQSQPQDQQNSSESNQQQRADPNSQQSDPNSQQSQSESQDPNAANEQSQPKQPQDQQKQDQSRQRDANSPADPNAGADDREQRDANQPTGDHSSANEDPNQQRDPSRPPPAATTQKAMSREEAERLLQLVRDRERQRREELARRQRAEPVPVEKDW